MVFNLADDEWDDVIRVHLRGTFVLSRPACQHWRVQAKEHGSTYGRLINTATGLLALWRRGAVELRRGQGGHQRVHRGRRNRDDAVRRDRERDHARRQHSTREDRLAHVAFDRTRGRDAAGTRSPRPGARRRVRLLPRVTGGGGYLRPDLPSARRHDRTRRVRGTSNERGAATIAASPPTSSSPRFRSTLRRKSPTDPRPNGPRHAKPRRNYRARAARWPS